MAAAATPPRDDPLVFIKGKSDHKRVYKVMFVALVLDLLAFTSILPLLPSILDHFDKRDDDVLYGLLKSSLQWLQTMLGVPDQFTPVLFGGAVGSLFSYLQFLACPVLGGLSDVYGRRPILLLTMVGICLSNVLWSLSSSFTIFLLARILGGLSKGNISLFTAVVGDVSDKETRGTGMALVGAAFSVGFIVGPMIGAGFAAFSRGAEGSAEWFLYPALFSIALTALNVLYVHLYFPETLPERERAKSLLSEFSKAKDLISPKSLLNFEPVQKMSADDREKLKSYGRAYFFYMFIYSGLEFTLTFLVRLSFGYTSMDQGKMFFFIGTVMALVQGSYVRKIKQGVELTRARAALVMMVPAFCLVGWANSTVLLYIGLFLYSFGSGVIVPCLTTIVSRVGERDDQRGIVMGNFRSLGALARALGPIFACSLYWSLGPGICYTIGGILMLSPYNRLTRMSYQQADRQREGQAEQNG